MITNNRICTYIGHNQYTSTHLCIFKDCQLQQRWCCVQCITQGVHNHGQQGFIHLIPWKDIIVQKKEEILKLQQDQQKGLQQCQQMLKLIKEYQSLIELSIKKIEKSYQDLHQLISDLSEYNFMQLHNYRLNEVIFLKQSQFINYQEQQIKSYKKIDQYIKSIIQEFQDYRNEFHQINDLKQVKYQIKQIDKFNQNDSGASQVSNNQKYLVYSIDKLLKIYDIQKEDIIKEIIVDASIQVIQFTFDSSQFFLGCAHGYVYGYDILNDFNQIFKLRIHLSYVYNIRTIENQYLITCSDDKTIIKTNITTKQQLFQLIGHSQYIVAIDYNDIDDILISGSGDRSIKLWDCKNKCILINKEQSHSKSVTQIQLINNFQNVLSLDVDNNLYKWRIDLSQKILFKIQEFKDPNKIINFYQINQNQNLILICQKYVQILNDQFETINQIDHNAGDFNSLFYECRQLDDGKCIQIRSSKKIILAIAQN